MTEVPLSYPVPESVHQRFQALVDEGRRIEAAWTAYRHFCVPDDIPPLVLDLVQRSFFAGAHHAWEIAIAQLPDEVGDNLPMDNVEVMDALSVELLQFVKGMQLRFAQAKWPA